jgi:hypothetical protein
MEQGVRRDMNTNPQPHYTKNTKLNTQIFTFCSCSLVRAFYSAIFIKSPAISVQRLTYQHKKTPGVCPGLKGVLQPPQGESK